MQNVATHPEIILSLQPALLSEILHRFTCRPKENPNRCIGTLLGTRDQHDFVYEAVHSFPVFHEESNDQMGIHIDQFKQWINLYRQMYGRKITLLGWYSIQPAASLGDVSSTQPNCDQKLFNANTLFINEFFASAVKDSTTGNWSNSPPSIFLSVTVGGEDLLTFKGFVNGSYAKDATDGHGYGMDPIETCIQVREQKCSLDLLFKAIMKIDPDKQQFSLYEIEKTRASQIIDFHDSIKECKKRQKAEDLLSILPEVKTLGAYTAKLEDDFGNYVHMIETMQPILGSIN